MSHDEGGQLQDEVDGCFDRLERLSSVAEGGTTVLQTTQFRVVEPASEWTSVLQSTQQFRVLEPSSGLSERTTTQFRVVESLAPPLPLTRSSSLPLTPSPLSPSPSTSTGHRSAVPPSVMNGDRRMRFCFPPIATARTQQIPSIAAPRTPERGGSHNPRTPIAAPRAPEMARRPSALPPYPPPAQYPPPVVSSNAGGGGGYFIDEEVDAATRLARCVPIPKGVYSPTGGNNEIQFFITFFYLLTDSNCQVVI